MTRDETSPIEHTLVARMAAGDDRALGALYDQYGTMVYSIAHAILGDPADAEEATADTFLQVWNQSTSFDAARASVAGWLSVIARSRSLDRLRSRRRRGAALERAAAGHDEGFALPIGSDPAPDRALERAELRSHVTSVLAELPAAQRRALELAYFGGLSHSEIAETLGEPLGTVKTRIRTAMERLRGALAAYATVE